MVKLKTYLNSLLGLRLAISGTGGVSSTMSKLESSSAPETFQTRSETPNLKWHIDQHCYQIRIIERVEHMKDPKVSFQY